MSEHDSLRSQQLDEELSAYVDALLSEQEPPEPADDQELKALQGIADHLFRAFEQAPADDAAQARIEKNLAATWTKIAAEQKPRLVESSVPSRKRMRQRRMVYRWAGAAAVVGIVIFAALFLPSIEPLAGAATTNKETTGLFVALISVAAALILTFWWLERRSK